MSTSVRQSNLFAGEDFVSVYKSFQDINFTSYDFDTIRDSLVEYIRIQYPEDFNDYTENSEFIAIIELLAYLGTSLAFRTDLNARENILDTAERRDSIIRLARMINYQPKRNIAASGLFKVRSVLTDQPITDSNGNNLSNAEVFWNDANNPDWFDQFVSIINSGFSSTNPFGKPTKSGRVGNVETNLYEMNNVLGLEVAHNVSANLNGEDVPFDIVNPDFNESFFERQPDQNQPFHFIYRNDMQGVGSSDTGFFLFFKQGTIQRTDFRYDFPQPNRIEDIDTPNINNSDVYVQEIDEQGEVLSQWTKVPSVNGSNVIYNNLAFGERNIFEVISDFNDTISLKFPDGNFGNVPTGIFRAWYRTSVGQTLDIRPEDTNDLQITIPYIGKNNQRYNMVITFGLENTVSNGAASETNGQIKTRAPQVYYSQDRMVNNQDYNVFPLSYGNEIAKLKTINRTYSGHSRYIPDNDPTGFHKGITLIGEDGALYNEVENQRDTLELTPENSGDISTLGLLRISKFLDNDYLNNFFNNIYVPRIKSDNPGIFDLQSFTQSFWKTAPDSIRASSGFLVSTDDASDPDWPYNAWIPLDDGPYNYIRPGSVLSFSNGSEMFSTSVKVVLNNGEPYDPIIEESGPIRLGSEVNDLWQPLNVSPAYRTTLTSDEEDNISNLLNNFDDFGLRYDVVNDEWIIQSIGNENSSYDPSSSNTNWFMIARFVPAETGSNAYYEFISRGVTTIFESLSSVRFYWDAENPVTDGETGRTKYDEITLLPKINNDSSDNPLEIPLKWSISSSYIRNDGYKDPRKVEVIPSDLDGDGTSDVPNSFDMFVADDDEVIIEQYIDIDGYQKTRPWITGWADLSEGVVGQLIPTPDYKAIEVDIFNNRFIINGGEDPLNPGNIEPPQYYPLEDYGIFIFSDYSIIEEIERQLNVLYDNVSYVSDVELFIENIRNKSFTIGVPNERNGTNTTFYNFVITDEVNSNVTIVEDPNHYSRNGRVFTQNIDELYDESIHFKWNHYVPSNQIVDPSSSNIMDAIVLTERYYRDILNWKDSNGNKVSLPAAPTTEDLRIQFSELNNFKTISDEIIYNSGRFKVLFGPQAEPELQATFKAVKVRSSSISDNELKSRIINAVDQYFDINNWDFGERFYYTELAAFIHNQLSRYLSSVVIVPKKQDSEFGDLFEISARSNEVFISTASVSDVDIISNFTETNLRM